MAMRRIFDEAMWFLLALVALGTITVLAGVAFWWVFTGHKFAP